MTDAVREALEAALREIENRFGELRDDDSEVLAVGIPAFLRAVPNGYVLRYGEHWSSEIDDEVMAALAAAVEQAAKEAG